MSNEIILTTYEIYMGASVGVARRLSGLKRTDQSSTNPVNNLDFGWHSDIEGACAEVAFAKYLGIYWNGAEGGKGRKKIFKAPDVGNVQIRNTQHKTGSLIVRPKDSDTEAFVLMIGTSPKYSIKGWMMGKDAKNDDYWDQKGDMAPAWFVPACKLLNINDLNVIGA